MKKNKKLKGSFRYIIPGIIVVVFLSGVLLSNKYITKQNLGSIYNIDEAKNNFDNIKIGDSINYEVNGYSDWQVIGKDDYNGTIDVVSKTNTEDLTLEPNQTKEYYENKFQETANKYIDNNYVINTRTVNSSDLDYFNYDNDFWLYNVSDISITTSQGTWGYNPINYKMYVIPYVEKHFENYAEYNMGDTIEYSNNGVDRWVVVEKKESNESLVLIPEIPIELSITDINDNVQEKANQIINSFNIDVISCDNYIRINNVYNNISITNNYISHFLNQQTEKIWIYRGYLCTNVIRDSLYSGNCDGIYSYENGIYNLMSNVVLYTDIIPYTLGYRPVVTLKVKEKLQDKDKKEISSKLQVGDNVKYEAKGYKNWKVLSIDENLGTVDIISGGIVKNITLSGKEDWDNYEDIIQREVDEYKNGAQSIKDSTVTSKDLKTLKEIDKSVLSRYWILNKNINKREYAEYLKSIKYIDYNISSVYLDKYDNYKMNLDNISLYTDIIDEDGQDRYKNLISEHTYTAGLRPVITLKLDNVEKLPEEEAKRIEESTEKQEKIFIKEQETKNKDYKGPSKVDDSTSSTGNNNEVKSNDNTKDNITDNNTSNVEKIVYKDKPFYKYGFIIALILCIIEPVITILIYKKIKER